MNQIKDRRVSDRTEAVRKTESDLKNTRIKNYMANSAPYSFLLCIVFGRYLIKPFFCYCPVLHFSKSIVLISRMPLLYLIHAMAVHILKQLLSVVLLFLLNMLQRLSDIRLAGFKNAGIISAGYVFFC